MIIVKNEKPDVNSLFHMGYITGIKSSHVTVSAVDADGNWYEMKISYPDITTITFHDRYSSAWQKYLPNHNSLPDID